MSLRARSIEPVSGGPGTESTAVIGPWLLDSREVSRVLGIDRTKVFQMMARAELPVVRVGRCVRVPRGALDQWMQSRTVPALDDLRGPLNFRRVQLDQLNRRS